ncbi:MAG TPA: ATP-binding protein [Solirubrobacteraceae bacterium]|nr:ATP-binding protein [Solirubrobacteraceae bacterium]
MGRFSIARSLRFALIGLAVALAIVAAAGIASLYSARQRYENVLAQSAELGTAVANLTSAGVVEAEIERDASGPGAPAARRQAAGAFAHAAQSARALAASDPASARLVAQQIGLEQAAAAAAAGGHLGSAGAGGGPLARAGFVADLLQARQRARQTAAEARVRTDSRNAIIVVVVAGALALMAALALIAVLVRSMRRPLDELVGATGELASGQLRRRVEPSGPRELRELGIAFNAMADDLTRAQRQIDDERRRLAETIESLGDGLIVTEAGSTAIATVNPRAEELVPELAPGDRVDGPASPLPALDTALEQEVVIDHSGRVLSVTAGRLDGAAGGVVWTVRDVTARAQLERAKSEFVATASHELRSPLTSIKGFVELLERNPDGMSARHREFVDIIKRSTDRLVELVNDLLDVARIEADHVHINRRPIDVGEAVRDLAELMGPRIDAKHQHLGIYVAPTLPLALADPDRIRQVIGNLLTNAHLYTPEGGRIHIGVEADRAWVRIVVADSGIGMTEEEAARAFERFYRARGGSTNNPGTGLGLSIVKSLVDMHHGEIHVESEPGRGTTFHVLIPAAVTAPADRPALDIIQGRRVLIVDDEPEIAELIAGQLAPLDIECSIATRGEEALHRLRRERFDAVTLDILMPEMDGFEVLRQIRADPELRSTPIVFVSVFSGRSELSGEWVVDKPIDADELRNVLAAAVRAGRSRVLIVGREELQPVLEPALDELGIEHQWESNGGAAARVCGERRFEVALIDVGIRSPQAILQALNLRGRRLRRAVILFSDGASPTPTGIVNLGMEVVPVEDAAQALLSALRGNPEKVRQVVGGAGDRG